MVEEPYLKIKERKRQAKDKTYEERKARALSEGVKVLFVTCPLCGRGRPMKDRWGKEAAFNVKPDYFLIQARYGAGRGSGFFLKEDESLKIKEVKKEYPEIYENLKKSIKELSKVFT